MPDKAKILLKLPSRGRPERFFKALDSFYNNIADTKNYYVSCTLDSDDEAMNNEETISRIRKYPNIGIEWGASKSKIDAINRSMPNIDWDVLVIGSDDIYFNTYGFDEMIRQEMLQHFPNGDGYLHFKEHDTKELLNVMTVVDKTYFERFGYVYHPEYLSVFADNHQMDVAIILGRYKYIPYEIMLHRNPAYNYSDCPRDEMFNAQQSLWNIDQAKYAEMKQRNYDLHLIEPK